MLLLRDACIDKQIQNVSLDSNGNIVFPNGSSFHGKTETSKF